MLSDHVLLPHAESVFGEGKAEVQLGAFARGSRKTAYDIDQMVADQ